MPYTEFCEWILYFENRPQGWREDNRAALIMKSFGGGSPEKCFSSLEKIRLMEERAANLEKNNTLTGATPMAKTNFRNSAFLNKLLGAKGGDELGE